MTTRDRAQLVIALGEGSEGHAVREALNQAAAQDGKPVSVWARDILLGAAGLESMDGSIREIKERLDRIEHRLGMT